MFRYCFTLCILSRLLPSVNSSLIMLILSSSDHRLMKNFGSMRKNLNNASPHANRLACPSRFPEIFRDEAVSDVLEDDRCQSPTPITHRKKLSSKPTVSHPTHVLARQSSPAPQLLQAPIVLTIQVDIDESLLESSRKRIWWRQSGLFNVTNAVGSGHSSSGSTS